MRGYFHCDVVGNFRSSLERILNSCSRITVRVTVIVCPGMSDQCKVTTKKIVDWQCFDVSYLMSYIDKTVVVLCSLRMNVFAMLCIVLPVCCGAYSLFCKSVIIYKPKFSSLFVFFIKISLFMNVEGYSR